MSNIATVAIIKQAVKAMHDAVTEEAPTNELFNIQLGITLAPLEGLSVEQVKTALRKFEDALGHFQGESQAALTMDIVGYNPHIRKIINNAQQKLTPKQAEGAEVANG